MSRSSARRSPKWLGDLYALLGRGRPQRGGERCYQRRWRFQPRLEILEDRVVPAGTWQTLAASGTAPPNGGAMMMLESNGTVMVQDGSNPPPSSSIYNLAPQANTGSYVNGTFSQLPSMNQSRLFFSTATLPDGRIFAIGGEYPTFSNTAEIYDPVANTWTPVDPVPQDPNVTGAVTGASNASPIVITTSSTKELQNGMKVTISGVNGNTAANGTFTVSNVTATTFQLNGSSGNGGYTGGGTWSALVSQYGDDPTEVISTGPYKGQILAGYFFDGTTYRFNPAAPSGSQWTQTTGSKLRNDGSDEESWVKLPDGSILSYDIFGSYNSGVFHAQRYNPNTDSWVDASNVNPLNPPSILTGPNQGYELGPAFLQPDGNVIYFGANGNTAIYNPTTNLWSAGFAEPQKNLTITQNPGAGTATVTAGGPATYLVGTDDPGAVLPNGHILIALSPEGSLFTSGPSNGGYDFPDASYIYEYDPTAATAATAWTEVTPPGLSSINAFQLNMVVLPTGQVLLGNEGNSFQVYTEDPATGPQNAWRPTISSIVSNGGSTFTLTGTQLNGIDEGSNYGDDNQSASNYPILQFQDASGNIYYGRTFNWSSSGVATGATPETVQFTLPQGQSLSTLTKVTVIANGIPSQVIPLAIAPNVIPPPDQNSVEGSPQTFNLGSFIDPSTGPWTVDVNWGDGTPDSTFNVTTAGSLGTLNHTYGEEGTDTVKVTVTDTTNNESGSATFKVTVSDPAVVATPVPVASIEGRTFSGTVATFTDPGGAEPNPSDPSGTIANHYTIDSINWGDGTPLDTTSGTISFSGTPGSTTNPFTVSGTHFYGEEGTYTITVVIDHEGVLTPVKTTATIKDPAVLASGVSSAGVEGRPLTTTVATFTDPGGAEPNPSDPTPGINNHYTVSINWGDGTPLDTTSGTITYAGLPGSTTAPFTVSGTHQYANEGTYVVTTTINHEGILTVTSSKTTIHDDIGLLLLDPTDNATLLVGGNGQVNVNGAGAVIVNSGNSTAGTLFGNARVNATEVDVTGGVQLYNASSLSVPPEPERPTPDPLGLKLPTTPPTPVFGAAFFNSPGLVFLAPGTYVGGIHVNNTNAVVVLEPGTYYMQGGGFTVDQGFVLGSGVTIINPANNIADTIRVAGTSFVDLSAPTSGPFQGVVLFQNGGVATPLHFTGQSSTTLSGVVYAPAAAVTIDTSAQVTIDPGVGTATSPALFGALIAFRLSVNGLGALTINPDDPPAAPLAASSTTGSGGSLQVANAPSSGGVGGSASPTPSAAVSSAGSSTTSGMSLAALGQSQQVVGSSSSQPPPAPTIASSSASLIAVVDQLFSSDWQGGNLPGTSKSLPLLGSLTTSSES